MPELSAIRKLLRSLPECPLPDALPRFSLSTDDCLRCVCIDSECFHSRAAVKAHVESLISDRYRQAQDFLAAYLETSSPDSLFCALRDRLEHRLSPLREQITDLRNDRNSAIVSRMQYLLRTDAVMEQLDKSLFSSAYTLPAESFYQAKVSYEIFNPADFEEGLIKAVANFFCTYGYNAFDAIHDLERDTQTLLSDYRKALSSTASHLMQTQIVTPMQNKLSLL